jgi:pimeloyl-ACP methyl ester carboxylesterase
MAALTRTPARAATALVVSCLLALIASTATATAAANPVVFSAVRHIRVGDISVGYRTIGAGPALVMIMGFGGTMAEWDPALLAALGRRHRVIVFDNRGVATSTNSPGNRLTIAEMADDTARLIGRLGMRRADVLGWSMGSFIAQELVLRHPSVVRRLILSGADPGSPKAVQPSAAINRILNNPNTTPKQLIKILFPRNQQRAAMAYLLRVIKQQGLLPNSFTVSKRIFHAQVVAEGPLWYCHGCGSYDRLPTIKLKTLVADGSDDLLEPPPNSRIIARRIPGARLRLFPDAGHAFMFQYPDLFTRVATAFLAG